MKITNPKNLKMIEELKSILFLWYKANKEGLLSLDDYKEESYSNLLLKGIKLITSGIDPDEVRIILSKCTDKENCGTNYLQTKSLIIKGILLIQAGEKAENFIKKLASEFETYLYEYIVDISNDYIGYLEREDIKTHISAKEPHIEFDDLIMSLDKETINRTIVRVGTDDMALALKGLDKEYQKYIIDNIDEEMGNLIKETIISYGPVRLVDIKGCQKKVISTVNKIEKQLS